MVQNVIRRALGLWMRNGFGWFAVRKLRQSLLIIGNNHENDLFTLRVALPDTLNSRRIMENKAMIKIEGFNNANKIKIDHILL